MRHLYAYLANVNRFSKLFLLDSVINLQQDLLYFPPHLKCIAVKLKWIETVSCRRYKYCV